MTGFEITLQGHWFKIFGRAFWPFPHLGWSIGSLLEHWFHQNTVLSTHRRSIFRPTLLRLKFEPKFSKMKILIFGGIFEDIGQVFVLVRIVCSAPKNWWTFFSNFFNFFAFFDQNVILAPTQKSQRRGQNFFPKSGLKSSLVPLDYQYMSFLM